jgi:hypothetical protein
MLVFRLDASYDCNLSNPVDSVRPSVQFLGLENSFCIISQDSIGMQSFVQISGLITGRHSFGILVFLSDAC